MADLRIVLQLPNEEPLTDDNNDCGEIFDDNDDQGQKSFSTIDSGIMAFNEAFQPSPLDVTTPEELLTPLARLQSFATSDNIFNRRMVAQDACHILELLESNEPDFQSAIQCYIKLSEDLEPSVRVELMEQIPDIAGRFHDRVLESVVVPILVRYLNDVNNQVRKTCHSVLIDITKNKFLDVSKFEDEIFPLLRDLMSRKEAPDEYRTEAIALICQVCKFFSPGFAENSFLPIFLESCQDKKIFHVRKVCASNFSNLSRIFDENLIHQQLLPRFLELCDDNVWGVRKSCADEFPEFAKQVSEEVRINTLSPVFSSLLSDQSRWVRVAAFESLGPFISTFADSKSAGQNLSPDMPTVSGDIDSESSSNNDSKQDFDSFLYWRDPIPPVVFDEDFDDLVAVESNEGDHVETQIYVNVRNLIDEVSRGDADEDVYSPTLEDGELKSVEFSMREDIDLQSDQDFEVTTSGEQGDQVEDGSPEGTENSNSVDTESSDGKTDLLKDDSSHGDENQTVFTDENRSGSPNDDKSQNLGGSGDIIEREVEQLYLSLNDSCFQNLILPGIFDSESNQSCDIDYRMFGGQLSDVDYFHRGTIGSPDSFSGMSLSQKPNVQQNVIPQPLLENFLSMTDPSRKQTVDSEIAKHCAYSLPGVAYTLGRKNWHCLKDVYQKLASDVQWKVRRTVAASIHELAKILGEELTTTELVPIFNGFLKDLDDVRIGVLHHLADFLKLLKPEVRGIYLYQLTDFLSIDNNRNWRFRYELAQQLGSLVDLYSASEVVQYICPMALRLSSDRVVAVQEEAAKLIAILLTKLYNEEESCSQHFHSFVNEINSKICCSVKWRERALFCKVCHAILHTVPLPFREFLTNFADPLVQLSSDTIVNVRIGAAKVLSFAVNTFCDEEENEIPLYNALKTLQDDKDRDVRFYASKSQ